VTETTTTRFPHVEDVVGDVRALLDRSQDVVCLAHKDADADSLGSALAFALALQQMGKTPHPVVPDPVPYLLDYLPGFDTLEKDPARIDAIFTFDCATVQRFGEKRSLLESGIPVVNVDHHQSNTMYGSINLVEPEASASGQVTFRLLRALDAEISPAAATNLYAALLTDTGGYRHENTNEVALRLGADLVALGADPAWVALKSYKSMAVEALKLEGMAVAALREELDGRLIWSEVTQEMLRAAGADMQQSEGVIDLLQSIASMQLAVLFKETRPGFTKVSVRSRDSLDATQLCTPFGGGGHRRAAGAELPMGLPEAEREVLAIARRMVEAQGG
jgi:bifunctional oligoribonuclease and PAP phosphatase NrnA